MRRLEEIVGNGPRLIPVADFDMQDAGYSDPVIGLLSFSSYLKINSTSSTFYGFKDFKVLINFFQVFLAFSVLRFVLLQQDLVLSSMQFSLKILAISFGSFLLFFISFIPIAFSPLWSLFLYRDVALPSLFSSSIFTLPFDIRRRK